MSEIESARELCCYCLLPIGAGDTLDHLGNRRGHRNKHACIERLQETVKSLEAKITRLEGLHRLDHSLADQWRDKNEHLEAERDSLREQLAEYSGWSPHQFIALLKEHQELQQKHIELDSRRYAAEQAVAAERERCAEIVEGMRKTGETSPFYQIAAAIRRKEGAPDGIT